MIKDEFALACWCSRWCIVHRVWPGVFSGIVSGAGLSGFFKDESGPVLLYLGSTQWRWQDCAEVLGIQSIICQIIEKCPHDAENVHHGGIDQ